jgi:hemerythrin superfamily protein
VDAIQMLTDDHKKLKGLFKEYEGAGENAHEKKHGIVEKVFQELEVHAKLEEEIFYPAYKGKADEEGQDLVRERLEEHHVVDVLMREMKRLKPDNPEHEAKFKVLMENVKHHADEEEKEMFPDARKKLSDELDRLGDRMERRKGELLAAMR